MPIMLAERDTDSTELMDSPQCDREALVNTYHQFEHINGLISGWKHIYKTRIRPLLSGKHASSSLLDIGFGGGDIAIKLARWAKDDNIQLHVTGIETDQRAVEFSRSLVAPQNVTFKHCSSTEMLACGKQFDIVLSNHLIHHLTDTDLEQLLNEAKQLSTKVVLFNDIERSDFGYLLFNIFSRSAFRSSFITHDGLISIKRSYTLRELRNQVPNDWSVERLFPFRLLLSYQHELN